MNRVWQQAIDASADPKRVAHYIEQLESTSAVKQLRAVTPEQAGILSALLAGSEALAELLVIHPDWINTCLDSDALKHPRQEQGIRRDAANALKPLIAAHDFPAALSRLRVFKQREHLRIATRDLARLGAVGDITRELSAVADASIAAVHEICATQLAARFGQPYHQDANGAWALTPFCVFGLGKLGGQELNYSSDVDLVFIYAEEGWVFRQAPRESESAGRGMPSHQFFKRLIESMVSELTQLTPEGALYRVDLRLRPEGEVGPLSRSLPSYETFYARSGQTWERMMLIKARLVAGDISLASEFLEMLQPFRYPRSLNERTLAEIAEMKDRIENEVVKAGELDRNVKLGRGGIREVEFVVQTLQLLNAGGIPFLQNPQTLPTLEKLVRYHLLPRADADALREAYAFLRDVEHRLQMENNLQTHTIPTDRRFRERLAQLMGFENVRGFEARLSEHTGNVRQIYDALLRRESHSIQNSLPRTFTGYEGEWRTLLAGHSFKDVEQSLGIVETLIAGPGYAHVSARTTELALELVSRFFALCPRVGPGDKVTFPKQALSDPDRVAARLDSFVSAYGSRAMLYETWVSNPSLFDLLLLLFDRSEFLAETAIRTPDLVDELELSGRLRQRKSSEEILKDLRHGREDEDQKLWMRRYHETEQMRIGLRDILGLADFEQNLVELSALADACLQYAFEVAVRNTGLSEAPVAIIGLGKLGGAELNYGSDLDVIFVADSNVKNLPELQRIAVEIISLLSEKTAAGSVFEIDARLRPDGEKGLLVNTLSAYEEYYRRRAMLWEIQALSRARPVAGDPQAGQVFHRLVGSLTDFRESNITAGFQIKDVGSEVTSARRTRKNPRRSLKSIRGLAAYQPEWRSEIAGMRSRIEKERTPRGQEPLAIKTGAGGLIDAEFIAQILCLGNGWQEPNTLKALHLARQSEILPTAEAERLIENYRQLRRVEGVLRRWSFEGETVLPDDPSPLYRVAVRCGYPDADAFMSAVSAWRVGIRRVYTKVFTTRGSGGLIGNDPK